MNNTEPLVFFNQDKFLSDLETQHPIKVFKAAIDNAHTHLNTRFLAGEQTSNLLAERSHFIDKILTHAWNQYIWGSNICLVAVGGYGRGELHPESDIDLMILIRRGNPAKHQNSIESFLTFLWDIQLNIGHSVRTLSQCVSDSRHDITIATNLMETRTLCGDGKLRESMLKNTGPRKVWPSKKFFRAKLAEQTERYKKYGNTEYNLEPNVKEAPGGLRDIQMINWVAKRHFNVDSLEELIGNDFLTPEEYLQLKRGESFLWKVRYGLHLEAKRPEEVLQFDHQRKLAKMFNYEDDDERLGVEKFMQHYYQVVLSMRELNDVMLQYLDEAILSKNKAKKIYPINSRFQVCNRHIETLREDVFTNHPSALLEVFCLLGEHENILGLRAATIRQIHQHCTLIDSDFRNKSKNKKLFMRLLRCRYNMSTQLQRMTRYGVLGRYLPEFGKIIGQTQHDLFHRYPVDAHTLQLIKYMRLLDRPEIAKKFPLCSSVYKNLPKPELAFISGLFHDIGKGRGGDHSILGAVDAKSFCIRHGLPEEEAKLVAWLVENHLLMSSTSQRSDISDPDVIYQFAKVIGNRLRLDYLLVLTVADINATNPTLWNSWKASLLHQLYNGTKLALQRGLENPVNRNSWINSTKNSAIAILQKNGIDENHSRHIWGSLDGEFFLRENAEDIARYTTAIAREETTTKPVILVKDAGIEIPVATQIFIHTCGLDNVFPITAATLDRLHLTILDASLHRNTEENTFYTFYVLNDQDKPFGHDTKILAHVQETLSNALQHPNQFTLKFQRITPRRLKHFTMKTMTSISNDIDKSVTILEVITPDRPGLLAHIGRIFIRFKLRLLSAKIATFGERVEDTFHLVDMDYQPLSDPDFCTQLSDAICHDLDSRNTKDLEGISLQKMKLWQ